MIACRNLLDLSDDISYSLHHHLPEGLSEAQQWSRKSDHYIMPVCTPLEHDIWYRGSQWCPVIQGIPAPRLRLQHARGDLYWNLPSLWNANMWGERCLLH